MTNGASGGVAAPAALARMLRDAERERSSARERADVLTNVHRVSREIVAARSPNLVTERVLLAARMPIGFDRALWCAIEPGPAVVARAIADGGDRIEAVDEVIDVERGGSISAILRAETEAVSGQAGELGSPLVDVRGWYVLVPVSAPVDAGSTTRELLGLVYADGHRRRTIDTEAIEMLRFIVAVGSIAMQNARLLERTQTLADRDPLTSLYNRRAFNERLQASIAGLQRARPFVLVMIDLDDFKTINDTRGHAFGDAVLKRLAATLLASARAEDVVGRFAGDEFIVALNGVSADDAEPRVARLSQSLRNAGLSCSIGAARAPVDAADPDGLYASADRALYRAKHMGKNCHSFSERHSVTSPPPSGE